jgi:hypothetical protein
MSCVRVMSLAVFAAALVAPPAYFAHAQLTDPTPAPTTAPAAKDGANSGDSAPQGQPATGGEGRRGGQPGGRGADTGGLPQSVRQAMSIMGRGLRTLKTQAADTNKKDENLKLVADMERGCLAAKALLPEKAMTKAADQAKKDEIALTFRKQLISMMEKLLKLETAIIEEKGSEASQLVTEITALRDESHKKLGVKE